MVGFGMRAVSPGRAQDLSLTYLFKVVLVGDANAGKTATLLKFTQDKFSPTYIGTIGVDFAVKTVELAGDIVKLQIWDTAGQERFRTITNSYYRGAHGAAIFFDLTDKESFEHVNHWQQEMERYCQEDMCVVVVGTKADLTEEREVSDSDIERMKNDTKLDYFEVSCITGENINSLFEKLIEKMIRAKAESSKHPSAMSTMVKPLNKKKSPASDEKQSKTCSIL